MENLKNYPLFYQMSSEWSRDINKNLLGDKTNRSISLQTTHGFKNISKSKLSDNLAVELIHVFMILSLGLTIKGFVSKDNRKFIIIGLLLFLVLIIFYFLGKAASIR